MKRFLLWSSFTVITAGSYAADAPQSVPIEIAPQVEAVRRYLLTEDYPEAFKDRESYRVRIQNLIVADIDYNGTADVVVLFNPHFRQSPTIAIFQIDKEFSVRRTFEGLAPGPLAPVSGQYLDSHTLGMAVDIRVAVKPGAKPVNPKNLIEAARKTQMRGLVQYRNFFHADMREGVGSYVDMTHVDVPGQEQTCNHFEFSPVDSIAIGSVWSNDPSLHLAARVENAIYLYKIGRIDEQGFLEKQVWITKLPPDFQSFFASYTPKRGDPLIYKTTDGELRRFPTETLIPINSVFLENRPNPTEQSTR